MFLSVKLEVLVKINKINPLESLSKKLYAPNTKAPLDPLKPITSLIKVTPVFNVIACAIPINGANKYIKFLLCSSMTRSKN